MNKLVLIFVALFILIALVAVPHAATLAAADAICVSDPSSGPVGTNFVLTCSGYTPNTYVYAYLVEPSGAAAQLFNQSGSIKVNEHGSISYTQPSFYGNTSLGTGTWHFVAEQLGLAHTVIYHGETTFTITGGTEGVSGATLSADPTLIHKPEAGIGRFTNGAITFNTFNTSDPSELTASGMLPGEVVSFWVEPPRGSCSTNTAHYDVKYGQVVPGVGGIYIHTIHNSAIYDGFGSTEFDNVPADKNGNAATKALFFPNACEGPWHFVARGNSSHRGGDTWVTLVGNSINTTADLSANPGTVNAMFGHITFSGSGFAPMEHLSCWITSPQGQVTGFPYPITAEFSQPTQFQRTNQILADASGSVSFNLVTGSVYDKTDITINDNTGSTQGSFTTTEALASEGALGAWAMSCRGDTSGATAIARYTVTGSVIDP